MVDKQQVKLDRPDWDIYFMCLAKTAGLRSSCLRNVVGALIVKDRRIVATGYNGTPRGIQNCLEGGCKRCLDRHTNKIKVNERKDLCICVHAEQNALLQAAYHGTSTKHATLYTTIAPCLQCSKALINAGITEVVYENHHSTEDQENTEGIDLLASANVVVRCVKS